MKKHEEIAQKEIFLGLTINSILMEFEVTNSKLDLFFTVLQQVNSQDIISVRLLG